MSENQILYISSVICLILILLSFKSSKRFAAINLIVFCLYTFRLYYYMFKIDGAAWFYAIFFTVLQILIAGIYLGIKFFK